MHAPQMFEPRRLDADTFLLESWLPVPGLGVLPANAFVIRSRQPMLVDTGVAGLGAEFMAALGRVLDPAELRWIWLTHTDADHVGNLQRVLDAAPRARLVTTYLGMGKLGLLGLPQDRAYLLNPGQVLDLGDRRLTAVVPPSFDAPETTGLFDDHGRTLFSADCFGTLLAAPQENAAQIDASALRDGMGLWTSVDAPWLSQVDRSTRSRAFDHVRRLQPARVLGSHLPPAEGMTEALLRALAEAAEVAPFVGPDQAALEQMMAASFAQAA